MRARHNRTNCSEVRKPASNAAFKSATVNTSSAMLLGVWANAVPAANSKAIITNATSFFIIVYMTLAVVGGRVSHFFPLVSRCAGLLGTTMGLRSSMVSEKYRVDEGYRLHAGGQRISMRPRLLQTVRCYSFVSVRPLDTV